MGRQWVLKIPIKKRYFSPVDTISPNQSQAVCYTVCG